MTKHSPEHIEELDDGGTEQRSFERVAAWLQANDQVYVDYPESHYFSLRYTGNAGD